MVSRDKSAGTEQNGSFAVEGHNCWKIARANRLALLVDGQAYFRAFKAAAMRARHSILIVGWDVDSRTPLEFPDEAGPDVPNELGPFLNYLAMQRDGLQIKILDWDSPLFYSLDREWLPQAQFDWFTHPRLCFALDDQHPLGASQHQKIAVIDDAIAFLGGLDLTAGRLDTPEHAAHDPRRLNPDGTSYGPYHDVQVAIDGAAAQAIAEVARDRWKRATGQRLQPLESVEHYWPEELAADLIDTDVAIARTYPAWKGQPEVREIEALFLASIGQATQSIYIENQYFSATRIAQAIVERLKHPDCPEIVLILPQNPTGWLEQTAIGVRQRRLLAQLREADQHGRFHVYIPVVGDEGEVPVKVHAKLMIVDGRFLHMGSANLNNRSMGLDSECDIAVEGEKGLPTAEIITAFRDRLLAEHLGIPADEMTKEIAVNSSLICAIEKSRGAGRSLVHFPEKPPDPIDAAVADSELLDPEAPLEPERIADELASDEASQTMLSGAVVRLALVMTALLALAALWRWGPLSGLVDAAALEAWAGALRGRWPAVLVAYVVGGLVMFPVVVLIAATGLLYGPATGFLVAFAGSTLSAVTGYAAGSLLGRKTLQRLSYGRLDRVNRQLARRGLLSMMVIRLLPLAPFTLVNLAAGASHISFRDFFFGTLLGMAPGIAAITLFSGQLGEVVEEPNALNLTILINLLLVIGAAAIWSWRHFLRSRFGSE